MAGLSSRDMVRLWELGRLHNPWARPLALLAFALPRADPGALASLSIGQRDALLFELRDRSFGSRIDAYAECPDCRVGVELSFNSADICGTDARAQGERQVFSCQVAGAEIEFRLPNSRDVAAAAATGTPSGGRSILLEGCILCARLDGEEAKPRDLPEPVIAELAQRMAECDPLADIALDLTCPACASRWKQPFDITSFFWAEISERAKRLLREVHILAQAYGWSESEILSLSYPRREFYLEMVSQ